MDHSLPDSFVNGNLQARQMKWVAIGDLPNPGIAPVSLASPALASRFFTTGATLKVHNIYPKDIKVSKDPVQIRALD